MLKVREREEIWNYDEGVDEYRYEKEVRFIEDIGDGNSNWDYFGLEIKTVTLLSKTMKMIVLPLLFLNQTVTLRDLVGPEYDTILENIISNHGDVISKFLRN